MECESDFVDKGINLIWFHDYLPFVLLCQVDQDLERLSTCGHIFDLWSVEDRVGLLHG